MTIAREPSHLPRVPRHRVPVHAQAHEPVHRFVHRPKPHPTPDRDEPRVDVYLPKREIRVDTTFWQHRSIFAGSQEQLNELRREAEERAAVRGRKLFADYTDSLHADAQRSVLEAHRPVFKRLKPIVHVGLVPMLWTITTCKCGDRWPCNDIKQYLRHRIGWTTDITEPLKSLAAELPKPATRWSRLRHWLTRRNADDLPIAAQHIAQRLN